MTAGEQQPVVVDVQAARIAALEREVERLRVGFNDDISKLLRRVDALERAQRSHVHNHPAR